MLIGDKDSFAVECFHDATPNDTQRVFGRMCIWIGRNALGDITEPSCMLNVTEGHFEELLKRIDSLDDPALRELDDREAYDLLDRMVYADDERSDEQVRIDADRFSKFDFLTNGGESFDRSKSFVVRSNKQLRVLFTDEKTGFSSGNVTRSEFIFVINGFLGWVSNEGGNVQ